MSHIGMLIFGVFIGLVLGIMFAYPSVKGTFTVKGYKGETLIYQKTYENEIYIASPGDKFDRVEILN
jgi:hypothetical protein